ncbi:Diacylglycerol kinase 7 [Camellia lanceoleosa]|uniref:Diacylglycerol kinase 7 n=1 Tax=Camellia lanceoleosa TaxID=1840588 RepID=A0ACC0HNS8_9ERIC|nr:Diacylglycerol kinase 7 [Camellia lanceoleosa]
MLRRSIAQNRNKFHFHQGQFQEFYYLLLCMSIVALNLNNYTSGRNPWGNLTLEYLEKRGFVGAHVNDGLLKIFGLKQGWHASFVLSDLISAKHIAQILHVEIFFHSSRLHIY